VDSVETTYLLDVATPLTMVLSETTGEDTIHYLHGLGLVAESDGTSTDYFLTDGLGSVRQLADPTAGVLLAQTFDPYGNLYASAGAGQSAFGFANEYTDATGLLYLRARYYNPAQGRFLNMDPSRQEQNPYWYVGGNPVLYTDPAGLCADSRALNGGGWPQWLGGEPCVYPTITYVPLSPDFVQPGLGPEYSDWYEGTYSGCFMCHAGKAYGKSVLTNEELEAYDRLLQQRALALTAAGTAGLACGLASEAVLLCAGNPACVSRVMYYLTIADAVDDTVVQVSALAGNPAAQQEVMALYQSGAVTHPFEGPFNAVRVYGGRGIIPLATPDEFGTHTGAASGRSFFPDEIGVPIRELSTERVRITHKGIDTIEHHVSRFGPATQNTVAIARLRAIANGQMEATQYDLNFYTHELREYVRYRKLGFETGLPLDPDDQHRLWNNTHTATLEDYGIRDEDVYHP